MREQCDPPTGTQKRVCLSPIGQRYYYEIDGHRSAAHYADARSAFADARRQQYMYPNGRIEPAEAGVLRARDAGARDFRLSLGR